MQIVSAFFIFARMTRGRDKKLIEARNKKIFERYYYWSEVQRLRFDDTIAKLAYEEFFLSDQTILRIVKRMLMRGEKVNGEALKPSKYLGFRFRPRARRRSCEPSLFPE